MWQFLKKKIKSENSVAEPITDLKIENVRPGAVFELSNIGSDMEDFTLTVLAMHVYRQGNFIWHELECDRGGEKIWLDIEQDDELEVSIGLRRLDLHDIGLTEENLAKIEKNKKGSLLFESVEYKLAETGKCQFLRNGNEAHSESLTYWDFDSESDKSIGIELWEDKSFTVTCSVAIKPSQVMVYSTN